MFRAVDGISFSVQRGESVGLVGESGCGKSTTSTMVMRLIDKSDGIITFDGEDIGSIPAKEFARLPMRKRIQMVFQDATDSLNPRFTAVRAIADPTLRLGNIKGNGALRDRCEELARKVGLPPGLLDRFSHQLSGGQKARVGIARAIALDPDLIIPDEPTAAIEAFALKRGVCQDLTHIYIAAARSLGIPARYMGGHLHRTDGIMSKEVGHVWAEAFVPDLGWVSFDAANGISATDAYVRIAAGLDYLGASPVRGSRHGGGNESLQVAVNVSQMGRQSQS